MSDKRKYIQYATRYLISPHFDHVLEFGVAAGKSMKIIKEELDKKEKKYNIFGFDSFEGLQEDWITPDGNILLKKGTFSTKGVTPNIPDVVWFEGWFEDTIPDYLKIAQPIALLHIDCDQYKPAREILYGLKDFIVENTIIAIDDWFYGNNSKYNDTTQKAFNEWITDFNIIYKFHKFPGRDSQKIVEVL